MSDPTSAEVDLGLLRTFVEVARARTLALASRQIGRSQPAVSRRISKLEEDLGVALFERRGRGLKLTGEGRLLLERCSDVLSAVRDLTEDLRAPRGPLRGSVAIGTLPSLARHLLVDPIASLLVGEPALRLDLVLEHEDALLDRLRVGSVDLLVLVGDPDLRDLKGTSLGTDRFVAVMSPDLAPRGKRIGPKDLAGLRYLAWDGPRDSTFARVSSFASKRGLVGRSTPRIPNIETLRELAVRGVGYTILPRYTVRDHLAARRLIAREVTGLDAPLPVVLVERKTPSTSRAVQEVRATFSRVAVA